MSLSQTLRTMAIINTYFGCGTLTFYTHSWCMEFNFPNLSQRSKFTRCQTHKYFKRVTKYIKLFARNAHRQVHFTECVSFARIPEQKKDPHRINIACLHSLGASPLCTFSLRQLLLRVRRCVRQVDSRSRPFHMRARALRGGEKNRGSSSLSWAASGVDPVLPQQVALSAAVATLFFYCIFAGWPINLPRCRHRRFVRTTFYQLIVRGNWRPHHLVLRHVFVLTRARR
jgi:hypothetical protein